MTNQNHFQSCLTCHSIKLKYIKNISNKLAINGKLVNIIRYTTIKGNTDGNGIIYIGQQAPDGAMPILVQIGDSTKWFECTILSKSIDNTQHFAARIRNADGSAYASIKNMVIGVLWGV